MGLKSTLTEDKYGIENDTSPGHVKTKKYTHLNPNPFHSIPVTTEKKNRPDDDAKTNSKLTNATNDVHPPSLPAAFTHVLKYSKNNLAKEDRKEDELDGEQTQDSVKKVDIGLQSLPFVHNEKSIVEYQKTKNVKGDRKDVIYKYRPKTGLP